MVWTLAYRYLKSRRVALVAVTSIAVGVMAMIVVTSLMDGVQAYIRSHIRGTQSDISVSWAGSNPGTGLWERVKERLAGELAAAGGPVEAMAPRLQTEALIAPGDNPGPEDEDRIQGVRLVGIDFPDESGVTPLAVMMEAVQDAAYRVPPGERDRPLVAGGHPRVLLGDSLAEELGVGPAGDDLLRSVTVAVGQIDSEDIESTQARTRVFRVAGCFSSGREDFDRFYVYVDRAALRELRGHGAYATSVHLRLRPDVELAGTTRELDLRYEDLAFESWENANENELRAIRDQKRIMVVILSLIIAVAAVAILGIVYLMVAEKTRDIGILRSMGMSRSRLVMVFTLYGLILGIIGSAVGLGVGLQLTAHLDEVVSWLSGVTGVDLFNKEIYRFKTIPTNTEVSAVVTIILTALAMSLVAAFLPALKAAWLTPVRALRAE